jgi:hypothetical protein
MGYKYQNKLDDERDKAYWVKAPWWEKFLYRLFMTFGIVLALYSGFG